VAVARGRHGEHPKIAEVATLLRHFADEVEADLARFYGLDVGDYWRGTLSARRLWVLVSQLPDDAATVKAQRGTPWPDLLYLVARLADEVAYGRAEWANAHGAHVQPQPVPRPGDADTVRDEREQVRGVHDALTGMMRGDVVLALPSGDAEPLPPSEEVIR
jgi:hypothetical protein